MSALMKVASLWRGTDGIIFVRIERMWDVLANDTFTYLVDVISMSGVSTDLAAIESRRCRLDYKLLRCMSCLSQSLLVSFCLCCQVSVALPKPAV